MNVTTSFLVPANGCTPDEILAAVVGCIAANPKVFIVASEASPWTEDRVYVRIEYEAEAPTLLSMLEAITHP